MWGRLSSLPLGIVGQAGWKACPTKTVSPERLNPCYETPMTQWENSLFDSRSQSGKTQWQ